MGRRPKITVWDTSSMQCTSVLEGVHRRGVSLLSFNGRGDLLASVGLDNDHTIVVYNWEQQRLLCTADGDMGKVLGCDFAPDGRLVTCGVKHIKFWTLRGSNMKSQKGLFGKQAGLQVAAGGRAGGECSVMSWTVLYCVVLCCGAVLCCAVLCCTVLLLLCYVVCEADHVRPGTHVHWMGSLCGRALCARTCVAECGCEGWPQAKLLPLSAFSACPLYLPPLPLLEP